MASNEVEKKEKKDKKDKKEGKTFNDLDEAYQWNSSLDPEHIFDGEKQLIKQLKAELPETANESDKFLTIFLIARRHDLKETVAVLKKFYKLQKEYGVSSTNIPTCTHNPVLKKLISEAPFPLMQPLGARDKHSRMTRYFFMATDLPADREAVQIYTMIFWQLYYLVELEPLNAWREGIAMVVDLKDFGWKNIDMSSRGRAINKDLQGIFPFRFRTMMVVNGGAVVSALLTAAKLVVPKKMMSRVVLMETSAIQETIPPKDLVTRYEGGLKDMDIPKYMEEVFANEKKLIESGKWKAV